LRFADAAVKHALPVRDRRKLMFYRQVLNRLSPFEIESLSNDVELCNKMMEVLILYVSTPEMMKMFFLCMCLFKTPFANIQMVTYMANFVVFSGCGPVYKWMVVRMRICTVSMKMRAPLTTRQVVRKPLKRYRARSLTNVSDFVKTSPYWLQRVRLTFPCTKGSHPRLVADP
jgi:hypothetical protein